MVVAQVLCTVCNEHWWLNGSADTLGQDVDHSPWQGCGARADVQKIGVNSEDMLPDKQMHDAVGEENAPWN
jgi:hypothetical protein